MTMPDWNAPLAGALVVALVAIALAGRWWLAPARRYERALRRAVKRVSHDTLVDRVIPDGLDGEIQLDLVALTAAGLLVLEVRHTTGTVYGATSLDQWTALTPKSRQAFDNPLVLLNRRVIALRALFEDSVPVEGRVVLVGNVALGADLPDTVTTPQGLIEEFGQQRPAGSSGYASQWESLRRHAVA